MFIFVQIIIFNVISFRIGKDVVITKLYFWTFALFINGYNKTRWRRFLSNRNQSSLLSFDKAKFNKKILEYQLHRTRAKYEWNIYDDGNKIKTIGSFKNRVHFIID